MREQKLSRNKIKEYIFRSVFSICERKKERKKERRTDRQKERKKERKKERTNEPMDERTNGWMDRRADGWTTDSLLTRIVDESCFVCQSSVQKYLVIVVVKI